MVMICNKQDKTKLQGENVNLAMLPYKSWITWWRIMSVISLASALLNNFRRRVAYEQLREVYYAVY